MAGALESLILSSLHKKAISKGMDLNDPKQFAMFSTHVDKVVLLAHKRVMELLDSSDCNCGKNKNKDTKPESIGKAGEPKVFVISGDEQEEHD